MIRIPDPSEFNYEEHVLAHQRTKARRDYERALSTYKRNVYAPTSPEWRAVIDDSNRKLVQLRDSGTVDVHVDKPISEMSVRFVNDEYIGTRLMPIATVAQQSNLFWVYNDRNQLAYPDDSMSGRQTANEVNQTHSTSSYFAHEYALKDTVTMTEIQNADAPLDPLMDANLLVNDGLAWNEEVRIATVLTTAGNFGANTTAVTAGDEWNSAGGGQPVKLIRKAVDECFSGPGATKLVGYCSVNVYRTLSTHPQIHDVYKYVKEGFATPQQIASYFGLDELLVGKARKDTANVGQAQTVGRIWSDVFGVVRVAMSPSPRTYCFGTTFRWMNVESVQLFDRSKGTRGSYIVQTSLAEDHKVVAASAGYLITGCFDATLP